MSICESCYLMREYIEMRGFDVNCLEYIAIRFNHVNCLEYLLSQHDLDIYELRSLIYFSTSNGYLSSWKILIDQIPKYMLVNEHVIFETSIKFRQFDCCKYLVQQGYTPIPTTISKLIHINIDDPFWRSYLFQLVDTLDLTKNKDVSQWILAKQQEIQKAKDTLLQLYLENKLSKDVMIYMIYPYL
jgi:hypothetical protein